MYLNCINSIALRQIGNYILRMVAAVHSSMGNVKFWVADRLTIHWYQCTVQSPWQFVLLPEFRQMNASAEGACAQKCQRFTRAQPLRTRTLDYPSYNALSRRALPHSTDGSVVEFSPATREARVRFPVSATFFFLFFFYLFYDSLLLFSLCQCNVLSPLPGFLFFFFQSVQFFSPHCTFFHFIIILI